MTTGALLQPAPARVRVPGVAHTYITLFVWLLPFHSLFVAALVGFGIDHGIVRLIAGWKEVAVLLLLAWVGARAILGRHPRLEVGGADLTMAGMMALAAVFLVLENPLFRADIPVGAELYGFRDAVFFMLLYFVGRTLPELGQGGTIRRNIFIMAVVISALGVLERIFVTPDVLVLMGVAAYVNDFLGMSAFTAGNEWELPQNYWSVLGGVPVRRAGSVFLNSQGFAVPFLLLMPTAAACVLHRRPRPPLLAWAGYALLWAGLLVTITRVTILVCLIQIALFYIMFRRPEWAVGTTVAAVLAFATFIAVVPGLREFVWETITWQTASSESHVRDWTRGLVAFLERPWGHGLGLTDHVAIRFGIPPISSDNMFLAYATQLGVVGLAGILGVLLVILGAGWRVYRSGGSDDVRRLGAVVFLASLGILVNGSTAPVFASNLLAYLYFGLAGATVTLAQNIGARQSERSLT